MKVLSTEVLVIGSGFGAAPPALRLAESGLHVLMLEKGPEIVPERDFQQTQDPKYLLKYLKGVSGDALSMIYAEGLGGGSGFYEMVSLRTPSVAFQQVGRDGKRLWPTGMDRATLDPFYDIAEQMQNVEQIEVEDIPKSGATFALLMKNLGYSCDRARYAVRGCVGAGYCVTGCIFGAKQSLHMNYLPRARAAGVKVLCNVEATEIVPLLRYPGESGSLLTVRQLPELFEVRCRNVESGDAFTIRTKLLILAGGTVGSARLLLRSGRWLPRLSRHVGKNIAYNGSVKAAGILPERFIEGDMFTGRSHPGMISYHFLESRGITISSGKPLPVDVIAYAHLTGENESRSPAFWGEPHVELMKEYRRRVIAIYALGLTPPDVELELKGNEEVSPVLNIREDVRRYYTETKELLQSILRRNGCTVLEPRIIDSEGKEYNDIHFSSAHMVGSCRMADSSEQGVVDSNCEVFGYPGMFVTDGAAIPSSLAVNSALTILANAERAAHGIERRFGRGEERKLASWG